MIRQTYLGYVSWDLYYRHGWPFIEAAFAGARGLPGFQGLRFETEEFELYRVYAECGKVQ